MLANFKKKQKKHQVASWALQFGLFLIIFFFIFLVVANIRIYQKKKELNAQLEGLKNKIQAMEHNNATLKEGIEKSDDPDYIEKIAREELDLQKPGESVVSFVVAPSQPQDGSKEPKNILQVWLGWVGNLFKK